MHNSEMWIYTIVEHNSILDAEINSTLKNVPPIHKQRNSLKGMFYDSLGGFLWCGVI